MKPIINYFRSLPRLLIAILVLISVLVMVRLGVWQLDRLQQRRATNAIVSAQISAPILDLNQVSTFQNLTSLTYRSVKVSGVYDYDQQVYLKNQVWGNQIGVHLLTPLKIFGSNHAIVVDRGWIPFSDAVPGKVELFNQPGQVTVTGDIQMQQAEPTFLRAPDPTFATGHSLLLSWIVVNIDGIQKQVNYPLLPVYIQQSPGVTTSLLPYQVQSAPDLSDGPHLSYAIQWFCFAGILLIGYPIFIRRQLRM